jgi:osmotically inducible lipoprotein OsmB
MRTPLILFSAIAALALSACGHNVEQRAASGAIAGAVVAGPVGAAAGGAAGAAVSKTVDEPK